MKTLKLMILSGIAVAVFSLTGCSDRSYDSEIKRSAQQSEELRDRMKYSQDDR